MFPHRSRVSLAAFLAISITLLLLGLFALLLPLDATQAQTQPEALGSLRGVVRNIAGDPLPDITVTLQHYHTAGEQRQVATNSAGVYEFLALPSGAYVLHFSDANAAYATKYYMAADYAIDATPVTVNGNDVDNTAMELAPAGAISLTLQSTTPVTTTAYSLRLYRQTRAGRWLAYRELYFDPPTQHYRFDGLPVGNYRLCATINSYYIVYRSGTECYENAVPDMPEQLALTATDIQVQAGQARQITIDFDDNSQVEGTILAPDGTPLADIPVALVQEYSYSQATTTSDQNGRFRLPIVPKGIYRLVFNPPSTEPNQYLTFYYPNAIQFANAEGLAIDGSTHISVTARMRPTARVMGKVVLPDDVPVMQASFYLFRQASDGSFYGVEECFSFCTPLSQYDSVTGAYTVMQLAGGTYRMGVSYFLPSTQNSQFQFYGGNSLDQADNIQLNAGATQRNINFTVGEGDFDGVIAGRVTADGQPMAGIEVGLFLPGFSSNRSAMPYFATVTNADGRYALEGLAMGYYQVGARDPSGKYATTFFNEDPFPHEMLINPVPGDTIWYSGTGDINNVDIQLSPGATVRGHVRLQNRARGDFSVQIARRTQPWPDPYSAIVVPYADERTDARGYYEITGLVSGTYFLRALEPVGKGEFFDNPIFYPGTYDGYATQLITITTGQNLENLDIWFYPTPTYFMPILENGPAADEGTDGGNDNPIEPPLPTPWPPVPIPTPTPARP